MEWFILWHNFYVAASVLTLLLNFPMMFASLLVNNILVVINFVRFTLFITIIVEVPCNWSYHTSCKNIGLYNLTDVNWVNFPILVWTPY